MSKFKPQHSRLLFIDKKISEGKYPNCNYLADEWEVSSKTIQRDLEYMRYQLDAPLEYSAKRRGYYYTEKNFKLPALSMKESELFGMYLSEKLLVQYEGTPIYKSLCSVFEKIEQSLPDKISMDPTKEQDKFTVIPPFSTTVLPDVWESIIDSLRSSQQIQVQYKTPGQIPVTRDLDPYHAVRFEGDWYIIGHCHLRNAIRTFSMSRIFSTIQTGKNFKIPDDFDFKKLSGSHFGVHWSNEEIKVKIRFNRQVANYVEERTWHPSQRIEKCDNGDVILELCVNHLLELKRWILSWGEDAHIIEPHSFAQSVAKTLVNSTKHYSNLS
ncbi:MAG: putative DNA-binding transcriptional regulator YafY [Desulforhopalus sp.]|jgi:predicted DNA-binding transcriptional regulator YafY